MATATACCPGMFQRRLKEDDATALAAAFKALADPTRVRLLNFLARQSNGEACVCELTAPVGLSQPTVTHHLQILNSAGLVEREKRGTWVYYRVSQARLEALRGALAPGDSRRSG
ncbi:MAG: helix-turn-helix transcriptional regulator [Deltaproteobacteria bacterium]|nr:MAG: helix-turn-helix transcriptional regulator [Deltaproteobacteria bacterium]